MTKAVSKTVDQMIAEILRREGGFVDDPADKGGATNHGVSLRYARGIGLDLNKDGQTTRDDIEMVTPEIAADLYRQDFFIGPKLDRLPPEIQAQMFDMAVNHGPARAVIILQETLNQYRRAAMHGWQEEPFSWMKEDGIAGAMTRQAAEIWIAAVGVEWANSMLAAQRKDFYREIARRDVSQRRFLAGWIARANEFNMREDVV